MTKSSGFFPKGGPPRAGSGDDPPVTSYSFPPIPSEADRLSAVELPRERSDEPRLQHQYEIYTFLSFLFLRGSSFPDRRLRTYRKGRLPSLLSYLFRLCVLRHILLPYHPRPTNGHYHALYLPADISNVIFLSRLILQRLDYIAFIQHLLDSEWSFADVSQSFPTRFRPA